MDQSNNRRRQQSQPQPPRRRQQQKRQQRRQKWCCVVSIVIWGLAVIATIIIPFGWTLDPSYTTDLRDEPPPLSTTTTTPPPRLDVWKRDQVIVDTLPIATDDTDKSEAAVAVPLDPEEKQHETWREQIPNKSNGNKNLTTTESKPSAAFGSSKSNDNMDHQQNQSPKSSKKRAIKSFLGIPLRFVSHYDDDNNNNMNNMTVSSTVHCVGENFSPQHSWKYRSCQFKHLCWNSDQREFVLVPSPFQIDLERRLSSYLSNHRHARFSTRLNATVNVGGGVSLGGLNAMTARKKRFQWFPTFVDTSTLSDTTDDEGFYQLENTIWIPFDMHYPSLTNPTAMLFDLIFPLYNLLALFGWERGSKSSKSSRRRLLLTNLNKECIRGTFCHDQLLTWVPLLGRNVVLHTLHDHHNDHQISSLSNSASSNPTMICAPNGAAGIGYLTDHGWKRHGSKSSDYRDSRNVGRGSLFHKFRQDALSYIGITTTKEEESMWSSSSTSFVSTTTTTTTTIPVAKIVVASHSNQEIAANLQSMAARLEKFLHRNTTTTTTSTISDEIQIIPTNLLNQSLYDQLQLVSQTCIYMTTVANHDNSAAVAAFLPRGASLIMFYNEDDLVTLDFGGGKNNNKRKKKKNTVDADAADNGPQQRDGQKQRQSIMLDWDLWNNMAHLHVHWLPLNILKQEEDDHEEGINILTDLVRSELGRLQRKQHKDALIEGERPRHGTFNGFDVVHVPHRLPWSSVHCVGNNFQDDASLYRSCQYESLCFDTDQKSFVILPFPDSTKKSAKLYLSNRNERVLIGHNARLANRNNVSWSPIEITFDEEMERRGYYELPSNVVWVPFFGETPNILNPGHLLWDYFMPIYTLATMFGFPNGENDSSSSSSSHSYKLLLTNMEHNDCVPERPEMCYNLISKFLPLMGVTDGFSHDQNVRLELAEGQQPESTLVCGKGLAGMGMLTDHALQRHGQGSVDYDYVVNAGRGPSFYDFRNFLLRNINITSYDTDLSNWQQLPLRITVSVNSSQTPSRNRDFRQQLEHLQREFPAQEALIQPFVMSLLPLQEQIRIATESAVYISVIGGATVTATFLPKGASLILFVNDLDQFIDDNPEKGPIYMDWDYWNNASYLRVHWMTISTMDDPADLEVLVKLVRNELTMFNLVL